MADLLTSGERATLERLTEAWNAFLALPSEHADDRAEFRHGLHRLQDLVLSRPARRALLAASDPGERERRCGSQPILARAGETLTCPNGHPVADIVRDIRVGDVGVAEMFANWRSREGFTPRTCDPAAGIPGDPLPLCSICGADPWVSPHGDFRPWTEHGFRSLPGDLVDEEPTP